MAPHEDPTYRLSEVVGTIGVGKDADLLVLDGDPLADQHNLTRVAAVYKSGTQVA